VSVLSTTLAIASGLLGVGLLRAAWARRGGRRWLTAAGWLTLIGAAVFWHVTGMAWDKAVAAATLAPSVVAFVVLVPQAEWGSRGVNVTRTRLLAASDGIGQGSLSRGIARTIVAGPVALAAALGLTAAIALRAPWVEADRLVMAGLLLPVAWASGAVWAIMDRKLLRVTAALVTTAVIGALGAAL
jgi:hypothetical protein